MSEFRKYMHIEHLTSEEVEGIFSEGMLYVFPKLDGSNGSVWLEDGKVCAGSRNNKLTEQWDNAGFYKYVQSNPEFERFLKDRPTMILYGEWLIPHTIKDYVPKAWNKFYIFDVYDTRQCKYLPYNEYSEMLRGYDFDIIPMLGMYDLNGMSDLTGLNNRLDELVNCNSYLMEIGGIGEGIVLKNYDFVNKYGRMTYAKIVRQAFKVKSRSPNKGLGDKTIEQYIVEKIVTQEYVEHERLKFIDENGKLCVEQLGKFLGIFYAEFIRENIFEIMRIAGKTPVRFDKLKKEVYDGVKLYLIL